ncbi:ATP-binding protein [Glycomyces tenuis]|uniref:ATP-binding protein n=1 Tax=Glycomyces tenuis TaxID=58116 RepID=UPI00200B5368
MGRGRARRPGRGAPRPRLAAASRPGRGRGRRPRTRRLPGPRLRTAHRPRGGGRPALRRPDRPGPAGAEPKTRAALLGEALGLWRGPALADFADEAFARTTVARWEEQRLSALESSAEARLELGEHRELTGELAEAVAAHPYRERLRAAHMRALHRSGRTGEALDGYAELRRLLADELGLDPGPELAALHRAVLAADPAEDPPAPPPRAVGPAANVPAPVTELIGRDHALRRIRELLAAGRLVTLTGPGGVGKTSAAVAAARAQIEACPEGVWMVDLTAWDGAGEAAGPVLSALSIPDAPGSAETERERLAAALRHRRTLLVLDNCEHVAEPVADLVAELLAAAPGLRVLATSREPLRLRGEARFELPPLELPDTDDPERLANAPAVRLFLARAGLGAEPRTVAAAAEVCRRLDGIPLALELAATRAPALGVDELAARLRVPQDRFGLLGTGPRDAPDRQRTLAAVIDWSWHLLTDAERAVLRRLSVHVGGCVLAAAEAVCAGEGVAEAEVLDLVAGLVDRSLVARGDDGRLRLLESVGAYCQGRLREAGEEAALRRRHAEHYLALAERADPLLRGPEQRQWLHRLDAEAANLRAALETFRREGAAEHALRLAVALVWHWHLRGRLTEARRALETALAVEGKAPEPLRAIAGAWHTAFAALQGRAEAALAVAAARELDGSEDPDGHTRLAWFLANAVIDFGDEAVTMELLEPALRMSRSRGDRWGEAAALSTRAMLGHFHGDLAALERDARRSAELFGELGDDWGALQAGDWLIGLADLTGDYAGGVRIARQGLDLAQDLGLWSDVAGQLSWLAWLSFQVGDLHAAAEHAEQAKRLTAEQGPLAVEVFATITLAFAARRDGRLDLAEEHLRWLLERADEQRTDGGHPMYLTIVLVELGHLAARRGDPDAALAWHGRSWDVARGQGSGREAALVLTGMAEALALGGRSEAAARLLGAAEAMRSASEVPLSDMDRAEVERITAAVRAAEPRFDELFASGTGLGADEARSLAEGDRA